MLDRQWRENKLYTNILLMLFVIEKRLILYVLLIDKAFNCKSLFRVQA